MKKANMSPYVLILAIRAFRILQRSRFCVKSTPWSPTGDARMLRPWDQQEQDTQWLVFSCYQGEAVVTATWEEQRDAQWAVSHNVCKKMKWKIQHWMPNVCILRTLKRHFWTQKRKWSVSWMHWCSKSQHKLLLKTTSVSWWKSSDRCKWRQLS